MTAFPAGQIPVYYINLASRPDRRQFMEEQFERLGIVAERVDAVTAAQVDDARMSLHADASDPMTMARVEVACTMSHEKAWKLSIAAKHPLTLVMEDDLVIGDGLKPLLDPALYTKLGVELVKLETTYEPVRIGRALRKVGRFEIAQLLASHIGTGAYIISDDMARRTLSAPGLRKMSIDRYLFSRNGPVIPSRGLLQASPAPTVQLVHYRGGKSANTMQSDVEQERSGRSAAVSNPRGFRWREIVANTTYTLRLLGYILPDPYARRQKRRAIPFEGDA